MVNKEKILLIGNGFNRTIIKNGIKDYYSSEKLLLALIKKSKKSNFKKIVKHIPFALCFESILNMNFSKKSDEIFSEIKEYLKDLNKSNNPIFNHIDLNKCDTIITTNYDYGIEFNLLNKIPNEYKIRNNGGRQTIDNKLIVYHIHGAANYDKCRKICLGTLGYAKYLRSLQSGLPSSLETIASNYNVCLSKLPDWAQLFFDKDIHIIGLNLSETEKDLWYLLTLRAYLISKRIKIDNTITYHNVFIANDGDKNAVDLTDFYKGLCIKYLEYHIHNENEFKDKYISILDSVYK